MSRIWFFVFTAALLVQLVCHAATYIIMKRKLEQYRFYVMSILFKHYGDDPQYWPKWRTESSTRAESSQRETRTDLN